jgi:hypothetical protein
VLITSYTKCVIIVLVQSLNWEHLSRVISWHEEEVRESSEVLICLLDAAATSEIRFDFHPMILARGARSKRTPDCGHITYTTRFAVRACATPRQRRQGTQQD